MWLTLIPVGVAVVLGVLLLPRRAIPDSVPLPVADPRGLARAVAVDRDLAAHAEREPLSTAVRALGSALRAFHTAEARGVEDSTLAQARQAIDAALPEALAAGDEPLLELRAVQLETFEREIRTFESTGLQSEELAAVAGSFVHGMQYEGWCDGHLLAASNGALRAMFKDMWNSLVGLQGRPAFRPALDEERALYALYLEKPHPARAMREAIVAGRRGARDPRSCQALEEGERLAIEAWRIERITRLAAIDPAYPADYARGLANLRRGEYARAAEDLSAWLRVHPDGPLALRARTFLRAAVFGARVD
jgi:hypothetical protein